MSEDRSTKDRLVREIVVCVGLSVAWFCALGHMSLLGGITDNPTGLTSSVQGALCIVVWAATFVRLSWIYGKATLQGTRCQGASPWAVAYDDLGRLLLLIFVFLFIDTFASLATPLLPRQPSVFDPSKPASAF